MTLDYELSTYERPAIAQTLDRLNGRFGKEQWGLTFQPGEERLQQTVNVL